MLGSFRALYHIASTVSHAQEELVARILDRYWSLFQKLHEYKREPCDEKRREINADFDSLFKIKTDMPSLNKALTSLLNKRKEMLRFLKSRRFH